MSLAGKKIWIDAEEPKVGIMYKSLRLKTFNAMISQLTLVLSLSTFALSVTCLLISITARLAGN